MPLVPSLTSNIRQFEAPNGGETVDVNDPGVDVQIQEDGPDGFQLDDKGQIIKIEHDDGGVTIALRGALGSSIDAQPDRWFANLAEKMDDGELSIIADDLIRNIGLDLESRQEWIDARAQGMRLMGLKIEVPGSSGAADAAPVDGQSNVRHPLLLEAVLRFQANAFAELLPADGPVKIRNDDNNATEVEDGLANALEMDMNHFLTVTASEYYPDTDRMLLMLGFGGLSFKKVYFCPLRNRPVSESVDANDLVVNNNATSLQTAKRITHRTYLKKSVVKRLQILGVYRDVDLTTPLQASMDEVQREQRDQQGVRDSGSNPDDRDYEIYECYCELDLKDFPHRHKGKETGLEVPYRVTIDVSSRQVLSIVRNYKRETQDLPVARETFVPYVFVPGFGFYPIGLLNILGNTTNAVTAAWRELLDAGMYSNFPGFLQADTAGRTQTNIFRVPPGGGVKIQTNGMPIRDAVMPLPYQPPSMALMQLVDNMATTGQRIGGTAEMEVGEGRADVPVGTTLALIEQATKVLNSVHKRLHMAQSKEFTLLAECFKDNPQSFWQSPGPSKTQWDEDMFLRALSNCNLVPRADPNTASHAQRLMKVMALKQLATQSPSLYNPITVDMEAIKAIGFSDPQQFMAPPQAQQTPPPELQELMSKIKVQEQEANAKTLMANAKMEEVKVKQMEAQKPDPGLGAAAQPSPLETVSAKAKLMDAQTRAAAQAAKQKGLQVEDENRDLDRQSHERIAVLGLAKDVLTHHASLQSDHALKDKDLGHQKLQQERQLSSQENVHQEDLNAKTEQARIAAAAKPEKTDGSSD